MRYYFFSDSTQRTIKKLHKSSTKQCVSPSVKPVVETQQRGSLLKTNISEGIDLGCLCSELEEAISGMNNIRGFLTANLKIDSAGKLRFNTGANFCCFMKATLLSLFVY